ncbi:MAG: 4-hydroxy-3-methylbut-2-enyl diphosphate reductase [Sphingomonas sp.]|nr:4-hydroxy-3-methylbut-2-enyl diphosphate reductase [Sphingomonas sp.]
MAQPQLSLAEPVEGSATKPALRVLLAAPRGFCAGVRRAIAGVEAALERYGAPVYVRRPIVHNLAVVRDLEAKGAVFVEELDAVPDGAVVIMSAHGIPDRVAREADRRELTWFDAVCPLVAKVHREVTRHHAAGRHVILIGHEGHPEIAGTLGQLPDGAASVVGSAEAAMALDLADDVPAAYAVQTTYSVDEAAIVIAALEARFADLAAPPASDICYATTNRQAAVRALAGEADAIIVAGAPFSSNACRLAEVARAAGCGTVQLVAEAGEVDFALLDGARQIGITAAASTPEASVVAILDALAMRFDLEIEEREAIAEATRFKPMRLI